MNKRVIMPQVVVYQNAFDPDKLSKFVSILKKDEVDTSHKDTVNPIESMIDDRHGDKSSERDYESPLNQWEKWYTYGTKTTFNSNDPSDSLNDHEAKFLYNIRNNITFTFMDIYRDYMEDWMEAGKWPDYISDWNLSMQKREGKVNEMEFGELEVFKHFTNPEKEFAIVFHTDTHEQRLMQPEAKQIITFTIYLNDDYEGGELQFIDEEEKKLITYKQKAGDVVLFPAGLPYWHSALSVKEGTKYFVRTFVLWHHPGSEEWKQNIEKYGEETWKQMDRERIKKEVEEGLYDRIVLREGFDREIGWKAVKIFVKEENDIYIDGREA